jgi:hypothetical protein
MARPPTRKSGAYTPAERQRRRRKRLRAEKRQAEIAAKRAENEAAYRARAASRPAHASDDTPAQPPLPDRADELVRQIAEVLLADPDLTIADVRAALDRLFGR